MVARLWWVRHGPTHERAFTGWRDVPADLSDDAALARLDAHLPRDALLVSSDLARASATADRLGAGRTRLPDEPRLREFDFGEWDGLVFDEVSTRDPDLSRAFWETPGTVAAPGGETWNGVAARVSDAIDALARLHPGADLVAVAHMGVILSHLGHAGGLGPMKALGHRIEPLSVTRLDRDGAGWRIVSVNHLA
ncbi:histidine phosphatase family protein [Roseibacterium sp. SDUM158017]|uniref:histidine phosphatase family protein n=1 Tax=Roseicyclus salinarum TaxID=3036773 RepID=UPI0024150A63|nr:histidine phosphatase family protein [Roseibacterium sp. SDUM158017]MDG4647226.1 histidine phosphatase family protein [Roseibacterium sp. SDUM158017]